MLRMFVISVSLLLASCASIETNQDLKRYMFDAGIPAIFGQVTSDPLPGYSVAAECHYAWWGQKNAIIIINRAVWEILSEDMRYKLMQHEIGHCLYGLKHTKAGIMKPTLD